MDHRGNQVWNLGRTSPSVPLPSHRLNSGLNDSQGRRSSGRGYLRIVTWRSNFCNTYTHSEALPSPALVFVSDVPVLTYDHRNSHLQPRCCLSSPFSFGVHPSLLWEGRGINAERITIPLSLQGFSTHCPHRSCLWLALDGVSGEAISSLPVQSWSRFNQQTKFSVTKFKMNRIKWKIPIDPSQNTASPFIPPPSRPFSLNFSLHESPTFILSQVLYPLF